jgi:phosphoribosylformylglycinamidine synthase
MVRLHRAVRAGLVRACHDCSEGGLAVAAAEMAFAGGIGLTIRLAELPAAAGVGDVAALLSESSGRFLVEVAEEHVAAFEAIGSQGAALPWACVGRTGGERLRVLGRDGRTAIDAQLDALKRAWQGG